MGSMKRLRWTLYITGAILILLGLWSLRYPVEALLSLAFFLGLGFCVSGVNYIVPCLFRGNGGVYPWWFIIFGILDLMLGAVMLGRIGLTAFMLPLFVAAWLVFAGVARILTSFRLKALGLSRWWLTLLNGVIEGGTGARAYSVAFGGRALRRDDPVGDAHHQGAFAHHGGPRGLLRLNVPPCRNGPQCRYPERGKCAIIL